jgi:hypothetical protein
MKSKNFFAVAPPDDGFDDYVDEVVQNFSDQFYKENEHWILKSKQMLSWVSKLQDFPSIKTAETIEKALMFFET